MISEEEQFEHPTEDDDDAAKKASAKEASASKSVDKKTLKRKEQEKQKEQKKRTPRVPDYAGWKEVGGWDERHKLTSEDEKEDLLQRSTLLENYISEKYYGDWYHNTALIVVSAFLSWLIARLGGGLAWLMIILSFTATAYRTSIRRLRRNTRDDTLRELSLKKLENDHETLEWLNSFLVKFWLIYEPVLSDTIVATANQVLIDATPGFIESLSIDTFTLGTKPPRVDHVRTFPKTADDVSIMDWKFSFTPNDTEDLTARQMKNKINPKIVLGVRVGKGVVSKSLPILVEDMSFTGLMRVRIKMMSTFPHIQTVDVSFLEPPEFDFVLKPIGGETFGFDINVIPGLQSFIKEMVHSNLGPMLYAPNAFQLNVQQMLAGAGLDSAIGVVAVTVYYAKDLRGTEAIGNTIDPYIKFSFNEREEMARSDIKSDTRNPTWNETKYLLVNNLNEVLTMELVDFNDYRKDKPIGVVNFALETLGDKPDQTGNSLPVVSAGKTRGGLMFDVHWFPALEGRTLDDGTVEPPPETNTGIVKFTVHQCKELDTSKSLVGQLTPYTEMLVNDHVVNQSKALKRTNNPVWDESYEFLVTNRNKCKLAVNIKDSRGLKTDPIVGSYRIALKNILAQMEQGQDWYSLTPSGRLRMSATFKPVGLKVTDGSAYIEPVGIMRFHFKSAEGLPNLETIGKIDPYVRVFIGGFQRGRTDYLDDTDKPHWDEVVYATVQNPGQKVVIEAMDAEKMGKDRSLGSVELNASDFIEQDAQGNYAKSEVYEKSSEVCLPHKDPKGRVNYTVQFLPCMPIMDPDEAAEKRKEREEQEQDRREAIEAGEEVEEEEQPQQPAQQDGGEEGATATTGEGEEGATTEEKSAAPAGDSMDGIEMPLEEQLTYNSGILGFIINSVEGAGDGNYLRISFDKAMYPSYTSNRLKSGKCKLVETGETMIRELEWSSTNIEIVPKANSKTEDAVARLNIPTYKLLQNSYGADRVLKLTGRGNGQIKVTLRTRYFPIVMELDPVESINNQGSLRIDVLDAADLPPADRSGKSDPFVSFVYNGIKVYKSKVQKKTLTPIWNECFETEISNRQSDQLVAEIYDWDMGPSDNDFLGKAIIPLPELEPMVGQVQVLELQGVKGGGKHQDKTPGIRLKLTFKPQYVTKKHSSSDFAANFAGTIGAPGKMITEVGGQSVKVVGNVAGGVYGGAGAVAGGVVGGVSTGVTKGGSLLKGLTGRKKKDKESGDGDTSMDTSMGGGEGNEELTATASTAADTSANSLRATQSNNNASHKRAGSSSTDFSAMPGNGELKPGQVSLVMARGFDVDTLQIRVSVFTKKEKEIHKTSVKPTKGEVKIDENVPFKATADSTLLFRVRDHKSLGRDTEIGEGSLVVGESAGGQRSVAIGDGELLVYINY